MATMTLAESGKTVENLWTEIVSAFGGVLVTLLTLIGVGWKTRGSKGEKELESSAHVTAAQIEANGVKHAAQVEADSNVAVTTITHLSERVSLLEKHNARQDVKIEELVRENAKLMSNNTLLREQNILLKRQIGVLENERDSLEEELRIVRGALQGPISDAMETLDTLENVPADEPTE